ncbi:MAG: DUF1501 domain-containing protein, partial [Verrucomicrobiota bacterium]
MKRRTFIKTGALVGVGTAALPHLGSATTALPKGKAEHCIMIWLGGGAAQIDTFDPKAKGDPKAKKAGCFYDKIPTVVDGVDLCEHLPLCARIMDRISVLRTTHHSVVDEHGAASYWMHTGRPVSGTSLPPSTFDYA